METAYDLFKLADPENKYDSLAKQLSPQLDKHLSQSENWIKNYYNCTKYQRESKHKKLALQQFDYSVNRGIEALSTLAACVISYHLTQYELMPESLGYLSTGFTGFLSTCFWYDAVVNMYNVKTNSDHDGSLDL